jgi:hypothetical protein
MPIKNLLEFSFQSITTFLNKDGVEKKKINGMPVWKNITTTTINKNHKGRAIRCGAVSGVTVFDFDDINEYKTLLKQHPELKKCYRVKTKRGYHIYFKYDKTIKVTVDAMKSCRHVDVRNDDSIIFAPPTEYDCLDGVTYKYKMRDGDLIEIPDYIKSDLKQNNVMKNNRIKSTNIFAMESDNEDDDITDIDEKPVKVIKSKKVQTSQTEIINLLACLKPNRADSLQDWINVGIIIKKELGKDGFDLYDKFSKQSNKYEPHDTKQRYKGFVPRDGDSSIGIGTLRYYAKQDDIMKFTSTFNKFTFADFYPATVASHFKDLYGDRFVYVDRTIYHYNGVYWEKDTNDQAILNNFIKNEYHTMLIQLLHDYDIKNKNTVDDSKAHVKKITCLRKSIDELRHFKKRDAYLRDILNSISQKIDFDQPPHLFAFNNK